MSKKHALIMVACCLIPIAGFALVSVFNIPLKSVFYIAMIVLCPLSHLLMMKFMVHGNEHQHGSSAVGPLPKNVPAPAVPGPPDQHA